jgi:MFS family permease
MSMDDICDSKNLDKKYLFSIISSIVSVSMLISGFLMDIFGRKNVIVGKCMLCIINLIVLIIMGFIP